MTTRKLLCFLLCADTLAAHRENPSTPIRLASVSRFRVPEWAVRSQFDDEGFHQQGDAAVAFHPGHG